MVNLKDLEDRFGKLFAQENPETFKKWLAEKDKKNNLEDAFKTLTYSDINYLRMKSAYGSKD